MQYHFYNCCLTHYHLFQRNDKTLQLWLDEPTPIRHIILHWAAPPISFYSNRQCLLLRAAVRRIIFPPGELKNQCDQILLLLLSRHLLVSFAFTTLDALIWLRLLQRRKANDLELCIAFSPGGNTQNSYHLVRRHQTNGVDLPSTSTAISCTSLTC